MAYRLMFLLIILSVVNKGFADMSIEKAEGSNAKVEENTKNNYGVSMDENNHAWNGHPTPLFKIVGATGNLTVTVVGTMFIYELIKKEENTYIFYAKQSFDYETQAHDYPFNIVDDNGSVFVRLIIINIDDESPSLTSPQCLFDEYTLYDKDNSTCHCTLHDPDGWLAKTTFDIISNKLGQDNETGIFDLKFRTIPEDTVYTTEVYVVLQKKLDYAKKIFYLFDIKAEDSAHHPTEPTPLVRAIVNVKDLRNLCPIWNSVFTFQQFEEEQEKDFKVQARDGDTGINSPVYYKITRQDDNYVSINNNGEIHVAKIDRDKNDISTYNFQIMAYVIDKDVPGDWSTTQNITFFIIDIDDNPPVIEKLTNKTSSTEIKLDKKNKILKLHFYENYNGGMNTSIFIQDIDTGENAQFTVELEQAATKIDYTEAFIIIPNAGYRKSNFEISVKNASYLDYEVPEWDHIKFNVYVKGTKDEKKHDKLLVDIELQDYNDEWPIFKHDDYSVSINETAKKDTFIIQVLATDRDAEDKILKHSLLGSNHPLELLKIESDTGKIFVAIDNAFDYDTLNPIFVQVRATDKVGHKATVPLTINLLDVNNKPPVITIGKPINVEEKQIIGIVLNSSITATDPDTTANLIAEIDWDKSYAKKNSRVLDMTNETLSTQIKFLDIQVTNTHLEESTQRHIKIDLVVNDNNPNQTSPVFLVFDSLYLSIRVTDLNTDPEFLDKKSSSSVILVGIININDNTPYFPEANDEIKPNRTVLEEAPNGTSVGSILAVNLNEDDTMTYECSADEKKYEWLNVNSKTGAITVKDEKIDADSGPTYYFNYLCTARDGNHISDVLKVPIYIIDTNNKVPTITIPDNISIDEKSKKETIVNQIQADDRDRDIPFHTVQCTIKTDEGKCAEKFYMDAHNNIRVTTGGNDIDRDHGIHDYKCTINCIDNPNRERNDNSRHDVPGSFRIILNDINDNTPELLTKEIETWEDTKKGDIISSIDGRDLDAGENGTIIFEILDVKRIGSDDDYSELFSLPGDTYIKINETDKKVNLLAAIDLNGHYGEYNMTFKLRDNGTTPNIAQYSAKLTINKFNFHIPKFVYPKDNDAFTLFSSQSVNKPLVLYRTNKNMQNFYITDSDDNNTCQKWDIALDVEQVKPKDEATIFILSKQKQCEFQLQINKRFNEHNVLGTQYQLHLTATINNPKPKKGEAPYTSVISIITSFMNNNIKPIFTAPGNKWSFDMLENDVHLSQKLLYPASYPGVTDNLPIFYFLIPNEGDDAAKFFTIDKKTGTISLLQKLDYETKVQFQFKICASNDTNAISNNPLSFLDVTVNVTDVNDNVPQWTRKEFYGALMTGYRRGSPLVTLEATDADKIDQGKLTYNMSDTIERYGKGIEDIPKPFLLDEKSGVITLNFQIDNTMTGHFQFKVTVKDVEDKWHNGPFSNTTTTTIFIITVDNTIHFRFSNTVDEVRINEVKAHEKSKRWSVAEHHLNDCTSTVRRSKTRLQEIGRVVRIGFSAAERIEELEHQSTSPLTSLTLTFEMKLADHLINIAKMDFMLQIISRILQVETYRQTIDKESESGRESDDVTVASLYFMQSSTSVQIRKLQTGTSIAALDAKDILRKVSEISTFTKLYNELRTQANLTLLSFPPIDVTSDNTAQIVQAWLIAISVVMATLCMALVMIFVIRTRQLNRRIARLTEKKFGSQESGLNRLGVSAPTTNKHAIEGSNPIFGFEDVKKETQMTECYNSEPDKKSITSGDSDLIGVEENPEFDLSFQNNKNVNENTYHI